MSSQKNCDLDEYVATFSDFKKILNKSKKKIAALALICAFLGFIMAVSKPIVYQIEASFKEMGKTGSKESMSALGFLLGGSSGINQSDAISWMSSSLLMKRVIEKLDLQGTIIPKGSTRDYFDRIVGNLKTEYAKLLKKPSPGLSSQKPIFTLADVRYEEEVPTALNVKFTKAGGYTLSDERGRLLGEGVIGKPFQGENFAFTIHHDKSYPISEEKWKIVLTSPQFLGKRLQELMQFDTDRDDKEVIRISFLYPDRHLGAEIVNTMMSLYKIHQEELKTKVTDFQIAYLEKRQLEAQNNLKQAMECFAKEQALDVESSGFPDTKSALKFLGENKNEQQAKLLIIELEMQRLQKVLQEGCAFYDHFHSNGDSAVINNLLSEMRSLKQQADGISLSIHQFLPPGQESRDLSLTKQIAKLEEVQSTLSELKMIAEELEKDNVAKPSETLLGDPRFMIRSWNEKMLKFQAERHLEPFAEESWKKHKEQYGLYISNLIQLFHIHEKAIRERVAQHGYVEDEFQGIDLATANELFLDNNRQLNGIEADMLQYQFIIEKLQDPDFSINSLQTLLDDSISNAIISKYSDLLFALKDQGHRSEKERERIKNELFLQRNFLLMHLSQTLQIKSMTANLIRKRIYILRNLSFTLIQQQISILEKQLHDYITNRLANLSHEKLVTEEALLKLKKEMAKLPQRWYAEQLLTQKLEMSKNFGKEIAELVESKNIGINLEVIKSTPLDIAVPPLFPKQPHVLLISLMGGLAGIVAGLCFFLAKEAFKGLLATESNLRENKLHVSGTLVKEDFGLIGHPLNEQSLSTLRRASSHLFQMSSEQSATGNGALIIGMRGVNFSREMAHLMHKKGLKVLLLPLLQQCESGMEKANGLLYYLQGHIDAPLIHHGDGFDFLPWGGVTQFGPELISSQKFGELLKSLYQSYDRVIAYTDTLLASMEGEILVQLFDNMCICLQGETLDELREILSVIKNKSEKKITFLFLDSEEPLEEVNRFWALPKLSCLTESYRILFLQYISKTVAKGRNWINS